ncbi:type 1 glutamine amidotransferase domain-containing protein [Pseudoalteromonas piscicida]|uniref:type 1 glutamine amidotransferase domain-containing protein n=1 Tax=Pseudoalteromonas piscicida TaxID=43662 RepID=UPI0027E4B020|nr:DJ-1/PfpI family protein [Pseudoalteromonas piscicida]WMO13835.1 type 1 glutamine amidotransferase domain-containing protein [Pseudoalteromonas piscicida]
MMNKSLLTLSLVAALSATSINAVAQDKNTPHVLMVLSSYGEMGADGSLSKPGFEFDELSKAYAVFKQNGIKVTLASPKGGEPLADKFDKNKPYNQAYSNDTTAMVQLKNTKRLSELEPSQYNAVFVVGGKGPMFDLHDSKPLQAIIRDIYVNNGVIGAVCHGPAALVDVKLENGEYLIAGKRVNGFTNEEEAAFGKKWTKQFPFLLEDKLIERGASFVQDGLMLNQVSIDGQLITGQNPFSTVDTAKAMVAALGLTVSELPRFKDDESILLVEEFFSDSSKAKARYLADKSSFDPMLLGISGLYQAQHAQTAHQLAVAVELMQLTLADIEHPMLYEALVNAQLKLNDISGAKSTIEAALKKHGMAESLIALKEKVYG